MYEQWVAHEKFQLYPMGRGLSYRHRSACLFVVNTLFNLAV